jgi:hypothetical protein
MDWDTKIEIIKFANTHMRFYRRTIAYALLYVVIEGYKELKLSDEEIDALLKKSDYVNNIKLLRHSLFHYQKEQLPDRLMKFIEMENSAEWALKVKNAFETFFRKNLPIDKMAHVLTQ